MKFKVLLAAMLLTVLACGEGNAPDSKATPDNPGSDEVGSDETIDETTWDSGSDNPCSFPLVRLRTGQSQTCDGGNEHRWPIGMDESDCHGWQGTDNSGGVHDNSANTIRCNGDGTFEFTQYAGNLDCGGTGTRKVYTLNTCEQDIPPMLYTVAIDLTCCSDPDSPECPTGVPSAGAIGAEITLNGLVCDE